METKYCEDCKEDRSVSEFGVNRDRKDGLTSYCKVHSRIRAANTRTKQRLRDAIYVLRCQQERAA